MTLWRSRTSHEQAKLVSPSGTWRDEWIETKDARGQSLALEIVGEGARPLLQGEDGLHRMISPDGNQVIDVVVYREDVNLGDRGGLEDARASASVVRTWNLRTREVTMGDYGAVEFDAGDPWASLLELMEEVAWFSLEVDWE